MIKAVCRSTVVLSGSHLNSCWGDEFCFLAGNEWRLLGSSTMVKQIDRHGITPTIEIIHSNHVWAKKSDSQTYLLSLLIANA